MAFAMNMLSLQMKAAFQQAEIFDILIVAAVFLGIAAWAQITLVFLRSNIFKSTSFYTYAKFCYASFLKPHARSGEHGQQSALESFYATQAAVYDATRGRLLCGRKDMLGLVAAQLKHRQHNSQLKGRKPVWVDVGGGTGWNIESMAEHVDVPNFFEHVYLVDLSPSLCKVARARFRRLEWANVSVICEDARFFALPGPHVLSNPEVRQSADLVTMSYSLSMIPDYYSVIDSVSSLLGSAGIIAVVDFYVQSIVDVSARNYTGGAFNRHVNWLSRVVWRAWFDCDRVSLEGARRDYLEYRFGTIASASQRNYLLGGIPYYLFLGCHRESTLQLQHELDKLNAALTESPYLSPVAYRGNENKQAIESATIISKACEAAVVNLSSNLPLPSTFYQNHHWRIYYNDLLRKHTQFGDEYIYAFNWEDPRADIRLLNINPSDVILTITSAGDNILDYLLESPRRIHAVDLNPNQNHLLELKVASLTALPHEDVWKLFGLGRHPDFHKILIEKLSPHLSSQALQYWLDHISAFTSKHGLYETGGSRHAIRLVRWLMSLFQLTETVSALVEASTLNEQREVWPRIRSVLLSWPLHSLVVGTEWFAWKAFGVPAAQRQLIHRDFLEQRSGRKLVEAGSSCTQVSGEAMWKFVVDTLDPVAQDSLLSNDNYFYSLCLKGHHSARCAPRYLSAKAHTKLSRPGAFDGLRIHTDSIYEVIDRIAPETLTIAVIMDSMDWFPPPVSPTPSTAGTRPNTPPVPTAAEVQVRAMYRVLKPSAGRVLLRSAARRPWYIDVFERSGFTCKCVGLRTEGKCVDRVNMYASTWICRKRGFLAGELMGTDTFAPDERKTLRRGSTGSSNGVERLEI